METLFDNQQIAGIFELLPLKLSKFGSAMIALSNLNCFHPFFIKLSENVDNHVMQMESDDQLNSIKHFWVMALISLKMPFDACLFRL